MKHIKDKVFIDTNVLVYYFQEKDNYKKAKARQTINNNLDKIVLSTQILGELFNVITRIDKKSKNSLVIVN